MHSKRGVIALAGPEIVLTPTNTQLTFPDLKAEVIKLPPVEKPDKGARQSSDSKNQLANETEKAVKKDLQNPEIDRLLKQLGGQNSELSISMDAGSKKIIVKIINSETKKVIRQIPPDELVRLAESLREPNGALLNQTV
jgi:flagellar protein FlaG